MHVPGPSRGIMTSVSPLNCCALGEESEQRNACDLTLGSAENPLGSAANRSPRLGKSERAVINTRRPASLTSSLLAVQTLVLEIPYRTRMLNGCKGNFVLWKPALNHKQATFFKNLHSSSFTKFCMRESFK
ncbi:hypothetical protein RRG08_029922 [Elysia crispata]|uniref:Uncharacterized protein n=1 Tax=Elysia crispata TaxID=231223 RepID=A0AAE1DH13_9GAST|nr:hypothetical protein RRG08_029922 [Elysia crispata]